MAMSLVDENRKKKFVCHSAPYRFPNLLPSYKLIRDNVKER